MNNQNKGLNTICTHVGEIKDEQFQGAVSPIYLSSSYAFMDVDVKRYPRYFNTPNQEALCKKIAALEGTEAAMIFGSGMAAVSTTLLAFLRQGDHIVLQKTLYGGTYNLVVEEFEKYGIEYTFTEGLDASAFAKAETELQSTFKVSPAEFKSLGDELKLRIQLGEQGNSNDLLKQLQSYGQVTHFTEVIPSVNDIFIQTVNESI